MSNVNLKEAVKTARKIIDDSLIFSGGEAVGATATKDPNIVAENYAECFIRDFVPCALVFLCEQKYGIVKRFLTTVMAIRNQQDVMSGHERADGLMPASFKVVRGPKGESIVADFGERAIGRVAPVDSALWWMILLYVYVDTSGDKAFAETEEVQGTIVSILNLYLKESFETSPAMLVPDGSFMIDRRMGVYGHPLEIQILFYGMLIAAERFLLPHEQNRYLIDLLVKRRKSLLTYVRIFYWLDKKRLNEIHRFKSEEFGLDATNLHNIYPESIPDWLDGWFPDDGGYFVGNIGPGRMDFRFFALGNLMAMNLGLATGIQGARLIRLYEHCWRDLMGEMPVKICYPAMAGQEWVMLTGCDPKNVAWSYHNGGNWPCLAWVFCSAAIRFNREDLARRVLNDVVTRVAEDQWPEYYDGRTGALIGRRANLSQVWTAAAVVLGHYFLSEKSHCHSVMNSLWLICRD